MGDVTIVQWISPVSSPDNSWRYLRDRLRYALRAATRRSSSQHLGEAAVLAYVKHFGGTAIIDDSAAVEIARLENIPVGQTLAFVIQAFKTSCARAAQSTYERTAADTRFHEPPYRALIGGEY